MPVPQELKPFFTQLVDKSKRLEINWEAGARSDAFRVRFTDFSIAVSQEGRASSVRVQLLNEDGYVTADFTVDDKDDEWIMAVALTNSADRKVRNAGRTLRRALEELGRDGPIGLKAPAA